jgi:hypothetical protein
MMTTQFVWGTVVFACSVIIYDKICHGKLGWKTPALFCLIYSIYLMLGGGYMGGAVIALTACTASVALYRLKFTRELVVSYIGMLILSAVYIFSKPQTNTPGKLIAILGQPFETFLSVLTGLNTTTLDQFTLAEQLGNDPRIVVLNGAFMLGVGIIALWRFSRLGMFRHTLIPLTFMSYTVGVILEIRLGRIESGWLWPISQWYHFHMMYYLIGVIWIFSVEILFLWRTDRLGTAPPVLLLVIMLSIQSYSNLYMWKRSPYVKIWLEQKRQAMLDPSGKKLDLLLWDRQQTLETIKFLREHKFSAFRDAD